jgi:serine/threonine protein kinase
MKLIKKQNAVRTFGSRRASSESLLLPPPPAPALVHSLSEGHASHQRKALDDILNHVTLPPLSSFLITDQSSLPSEVAKEIYILSRLAHPHLVKLVEIIDSPTSPILYLVMEYVEVEPSSFTSFSSLYSLFFIRWVQ